MNGKARIAWELYLKMETSGESFSLLQLIANDCYKVKVHSNITRIVSLSNSSGIIFLVNIEAYNIILFTDGTFLLLSKGV